MTGNSSTLPAVPSFSLLLLELVEVALPHHDDAIGATGREVVAAGREGGGGGGVREGGERGRARRGDDARADARRRRDDGKKRREGRESATVQGETSGGDAVGDDSSDAGAKGRWRWG